MFVFSLAVAGIDGTGFRLQYDSKVVPWEVVWLWKEDGWIDCVRITGRHLGYGRVGSCCYED